MSPTVSPQPLLDMQDVARAFGVGRSLADYVRMRKAVEVRAVDGVSLQVARGTTLSIVGESGCGKSTIARMIAGLYPPTAGSISYVGEDLQRMRGQAANRRKIQMIFQDSMASLNARWRIEDIIAEPIRVFGLATGRAATRARVMELLEMVGLPEAVARRYPRELSGGQRQRVCIARALSSHPELLICDEPTSALDVSVQAQIVNLLMRLQREHGLTYVFISHNLAVVRQVSDRVGVMYLGRIVEEGPSEAVFDTPRHPYTQALLAAAPSIHPNHRSHGHIAGEVPSPLDPPGGCAFHPRCPLANARCKAERPTLLLDDTHLVACHAVAERRTEVLQEA